MATKGAPSPLKAQPGELWLMEESFGAVRVFVLRAWGKYFIGACKGSLFPVILQHNCLIARIFPREERV